ncbi:hypothetical protein M885DRAFT_592895, partial [Pelagophyceae sp. CCMP2097]
MLFVSLLCCFAAAAMFDASDDAYAARQTTTDFFLKKIDQCIGRGDIEGAKKTLAVIEHNYGNPEDQSLWSKAAKRSTERVADHLRQANYQVELGHTTTVWHPAQTAAGANGVATAPKDALDATGTIDTAS